MIKITDLNVVLTDNTGSEVQGTGEMIVGTSPITKEVKDEELNLQNTPNFVISALIPNADVDVTENYNVSFDANEKHYSTVMTVMTKTNLRTGIKMNLQSTGAEITEEDIVHEPVYSVHAFDKNDQEIPLNNIPAYQSGTNAVFDGAYLKCREDNSGEWVINPKLMYGDIFSLSITADQDANGRSLFMDNLGAFALEWSTFEDNNEQTITFKAVISETGDLDEGEVLTTFDITFVGHPESHTPSATEITCTPSSVEVTAKLVEDPDTGETTITSDGSENWTLTVTDDTDTDRTAEADVEFEFGWKNTSLGESGTYTHEQLTETGWTAVYNDDTGVLDMYTPLDFCDVEWFDTTAGYEMSGSATVTVDGMTASCTVTLTVTGSASQDYTTKIKCNTSKGDFLVYSTDANDTIQTVQYDHYTDSGNDYAKYVIDCSLSVETDNPDYQNLSDFQSNGAVPFDADVIRSNNLNGTVTGQFGGWHGNDYVQIVESLSIQIEYVAP